MFSYYEYGIIQICCMKGINEMCALEKSLAYIYTNLQTEVELEELAEMENYSKHHFCYLFKQVTGDAVGQYIQKRRLQRVLYAMNQEATVTEISMQFGFETYAGFYKAFVRVFGCGPKAYIKAHAAELSFHSREAKSMIPYETDRCILSLLQKTDIPEAVRLLTDERVRAYLGGPIPEADARRRLQAWADRPDSVYYVVRLKENRVLIGIVDISPHHNVKDKEISYHFLPEFWGMGYAGEVLRWVLRHCREELQIDSAVAETQSANRSSRKLLERVGFVERERVMRFGAEQIVYAYDMKRDI